MQATHAIRQLVEKALYIKQLTPDIENEISGRVRTTARTQGENLNAWE